MPCRLPINVEGHQWDITVQVGTSVNCLQFSCSVVSYSLRPHGLQHARLPCPPITPELAQTHVHGVGDAIQPSHPLSSLLLPSVFRSIRVFSKELVLCIRWPKVRIFSFSISPSIEYSGLISFRIDWFDLFAVQGTLKEFSPTPQFKSINFSVFSWVLGGHFSDCFLNSDLDV